ARLVLGYLIFATWPSGWTRNSNSTFSPANRPAIIPLAIASSFAPVMTLAKGPAEMGLSSITDKQKEAAWRVEFKALGEQLVFQNVKRDAIYNDVGFRNGTGPPS